MNKILVVLIAAAIVALGSAHSPAPNRISFVPDVSREYHVNVVNGTLRPFTAPAVDRFDAVSLAKEFARSVIRQNADFIVKDHYTTQHNSVTHVYLRQVVNGLEVLNGDMNINIDSTGQVLSFGKSFFEESIAAVPKVAEARLTQFDALKGLAARLGISLQTAPVIVSSEATGAKQTVVRHAALSLDDIPMHLAYLRTEDAAAPLALVWRAVVRQEEDWFDAAMDAMTPAAVRMLVNWVSDAQYNVYKPPVNDPEDGTRSLHVDPQLVNPTASPSGWHDRGPNGGVSTLTIGNNVYAQENLRGGSTWENNYRPNGGSAFNFDFPLNLALDPSQYLDPSITNLFYINNVIHDVFYQYGFTEAAGNFQEYNFGRGGSERDAVQANAQDGAGYNNANFATPPDGQRPRMRMYVWNGFNPYRDGDFENSIIVHEYGHGISNRLTGGPSNSGCLSGGQSGGMGEGWSDLWGIMFKQRSYNSRNDVFPMGDYVYPGGIRYYPYTSDMRINPQVCNT
eukprot:TRINITY_DN619_c0_g1_i1.p2 TRINITY_DN619_c0_g1~~TRINITY_DN619_c0_g1_i1.p2  ORF type:complete len:510 (+),score=84.95 TRINITY_DN619_c0_g1_i1:49-1578(+)